MSNEPPPIVGPHFVQGPPPIQSQPTAPELSEEQIQAEIEAMPEVGFPKWVKVVTFAVLLVLGFSIWRIPKAIGASVAEERGNRYMAAGDYGKAVVEFEKNMRDFPDSERAIFSMTEAYLRADRPADARRALIGLEGHRLDKHQMDRADSLASEIETRLPKEERKP
jgi:hypothetical protein